MSSSLRKYQKEAPCSACVWTHGKAFKCRAAYPTWNWNCLWKWNRTLGVKLLEFHVQLQPTMNGNLIWLVHVWPLSSVPSRLVDKHGLAILWIYSLWSWGCTLHGWSGRYETEGFPVLKVEVTGLSSAHSVHSVHQEFAVALEFFTRCGPWNGCHRIL